MLNRFRVMALFCLAVYLLSSPAYSGAWTQDTGKGLFVQNFSYYSTSRYFDNSGKKQHFSRYSKYELNPYLEYGLRDWLTVGANLFADRTSQNNVSNWGISDSEFFARTRLWKENAFVFSAEPNIKLPSLDKRSEQPQIGNNNYDVGINFSGGYGFKTWGLDHFIDLAAGYNHRFGTPNDQLKFSATAGVSLTKNSMLLTQIFNTTRLDNLFNPAFTQSSSDDYNLTKLQISAMYKIDEKFSLQLGAFSHIAGDNVGSGTGTIFAVNRGF